MSTNILIFATRKVVFKKPARVEVQKCIFNALQTPTVVTKKILASNNPVQAYADWVLTTHSVDFVVNKYNKDDIFEEGEPIGIEVYNPAKQHVDEFLDWIKAVESMDYVVKFEMM